MSALELVIFSPGRTTVLLSNWLTGRCDHLQKAPPSPTQSLGSVRESVTPCKCLFNSPQMALSCWLWMCEGKQKGFFLNFLNINGFFQSHLTVISAFYILILLHYLLSLCQVKGSENFTIPWVDIATESLACWHLSQGMTHGLCCAVAVTDRPRVDTWQKDNPFLGWPLVYGQSDTRSS